MKCEDLVDVLLEYCNLFIGEGKKRFHEDKTGCHVIIVTDKGVNKKIECFDETKGLRRKLFGDREVYFYDEFRGVKIAITYIYRLFKLRTVVLTAFKKESDVIWPPKKFIKS